jgi:hypothetical protein
MRWHYTWGLYMELIIRDGFIKPADAYVAPPERPIAWFTTSPNWEETANKGIRDRLTGKERTLTREETEKFGRGLYRIGVSDDYPLKRFLRISRESKQDRKLTRALLETAQEQGSNPYADWWGTLNKVPSAHWKVIEIFTPEGWQMLTVEMLIPANSGGKQG